MEKGKIKIIVIGTVIGALIGAASSFILLKRAENENVDPKITAGEGLQLGLGLMGLMRLLAGSDKD
jgi:hypothetical protein